MFCARFFAARYFAARYFPKVGATSPFVSWFAWPNREHGPTPVQEGTA